MVKKMIYAEYRGASIPIEPWKGVVQSIYSKAVNLLHPSGNLISIVDSIDNMTDFGLVIADFSLLISKISNSSHFLWEGTQITFSDIIVDISKALLWSGSLVSNLIELPINIKPIQKAFINFAKEEGLSPLITKKKGNMYSNAAVKIINASLGSADVSREALLIDLSKLVGLGIGFTPSGDDFLTGVMLYETISGVNLIDRESLKVKIPGTTEGGRTLLILALGNSFPFYLKQFAESILNMELSLDEIVSKALMHGSTSGSDALTGFLWAAGKIKKIKK